MFVSISNMQKDRFWEIFLITSAVTMCAAAIFVYVRLDDSPSHSVAAAIATDKDPFEHSIVDSVSSSPTLYRESLPARFDDWSWQASANWRSTEQHAEGTRSIRADFKAAWSGIRESGPSISLAPYNSIALMVYPASDVGDLYIELYDHSGKSVGEQSISWYLPGSKLTPAAWQEVTIPLSNILGGSGVNTITGFSVSSKEPGTAFIDNVRLTKDTVAHAPWSHSLLEFQKLDPFKDAIPRALPYSMSFDPTEIKQWKGLFGRFDPEANDVKIGALPEKSSGSMAVFSGGKDWTDYRVDATVYWGPTNTFSILMRFQDDGNLVSCAFSEYGATVQIYQLIKGQSTLVVQSPGLPVPDFEPWKDVRHGGAVVGDTVYCYQNGEMVIKANLPSMPKTGSVGLETWTRGSFDYPHLLKSLTVSSSF